jgi:hypothetical protein
MTPRRTSGRRPGTTDWRQAERRTEVAKAVGAAGGVVVLTALIIFLIKPGDSSTSTQTPIPQTPITSPSGLPDETETTVPGGSTDTTAPTTATTTPATTAPTTTAPGGSTPAP